MIDNTPLSIPLDITIINPTVRIALTDSDQLKAIYELPSIEEIVYIQNLSSGKVSMQENVELFQKDTKELFYEEFLRLSEKSTRFGASATYLNHLSLLLERAGRILEAQTFLEKAAVASDSPYLNGRHAVNDLKHSFDAKAFARLEELTKEGDTYALTNLSLAYLSQKHIVEAIAAASRAVDSDPALYQTRLLRGSLFLVHGERQKSIRDLRAAIESRPDSSVAHANLSIAYLFMKNMAKAIAEAETSFTLNPADRNTVAMLSDMYLITGQHASVVPVIEQYLRYDQKEADLWDRLAKAYYHLGKFGKSMETLRHEASINDSPSVWNNMAIVAIATRNVEKAKQYFSRAWSMSSLENIPDAVVANYFRFLRKEGLAPEIRQLSEAVIGRYIERSTHVTAETADIVLSHILSLYESGARSEAIQVAERFVVEHEDAAAQLLNILNLIVYHYCMIEKNQEKAVGTSLKVIKLLSGAPKIDEKAKYRVINNVAYAFLEFGLTADAANAFSSVVKFANQDVFLAATFGLLRFRQGSIEEGLSFYKRALHLAVTPTLKDMLLQKMNLEAARYYVSRNRIQEARNAFSGVLRTRGGSDLFRQEAQSELLKIG